MISTVKLETAFSYYSQTVGFENKNYRMICDSEMNNWFCNIEMYYLMAYHLSAVFNILLVIAYK